MKSWPTNPSSTTKLTTGQRKLGEVCERIKLKKAPEGTTPYIEIGDIDIENKSIIFKDKKYCLLIFLKNPQKIKPFEINKFGFGAMCSWISVNNINTIRSKKSNPGRKASR